MKNGAHTSTSAAVRGGAPARVLYLVDGLGLSGKTKAMVDLIVGLDPARFHPTLITFDGEKGMLHERLRDARVAVEEVPCPDGLNLSVVARLGAAARRLRPAIIHCYNPRTMLYGGVVAQALGIRATIGSLSAFACLTPDGDYRFLPQRLFSTSRRNRWRNRAMSWLMRALVTVSPTLGQRFCRYNGIDLARLRIVPYGVDVTRFSRVTAEQIAAFRARFQLAPDALVIGSVGRLVEQKDYPTQLKAFAAASARDPRLVMLLVGDGPLRAALEAMARDLGVAERVRFAGHCNEVPVALRAIDIFVLASKFEPYGVALLEAKAAGTTIVATRVNEVPEILGETAGESGFITNSSPGAGAGVNGHGGAGLTGRLVPPEDPAAMANAFVALAQDEVGRRALGQRAAAEASVRHSLQAAIQAYQGLYDEVRGVVGAREQAARPAL
jgi:glycosyltransferase involved in cell wall biosynthesis